MQVSDLLTLLSRSVRNCGALPSLGPLAGWPRRTEAHKNLLINNDIQMPTAKQIVHQASHADARRRHIRPQQRSSVRYQGAQAGGIDTSRCRVVVDYTPSRTHRSTTSTASTKNRMSTSVKKSVPIAKRSSIQKVARLPPPRLSAFSSKRQLMQQHQRNQNVGLPSWESFHRTQHQLSLESPTKKSVGRSSLEALATAAARANNTSKGMMCSQKSMKSPAAQHPFKKPNPATLAHLNHVRTNHHPGRILSVNEVNQVRHQQQLALLHEMEFQKAAAAQAQELQNATLVAQAKHALVVQQQAELQQAALDEARFVNLVMDYNSPQMQLSFLPQGIELQQAGLVPQQAFIQDPRFFVGNQPQYGDMKIVDGEKNPPPTATLNEHIASVWEKYNRDTKGMTDGKQVAESESVPLKKRRMEMHVPLPSVSSMGGQGPYAQL